MIISIKINTKIYSYCACHGGIDTKSSEFPPWQTILDENQSRSRSIERCSVFITFECSHGAVSKVCSLEFRFFFKIFRFRNLQAKNVPFSCEQKAYPSHFSPFSNRGGILWTQSMKNNFTPLRIEFTQSNKNKRRNKVY